jgi:hypothetical protein
MGLNLESGFWACWRNSDHRGKSPLRLLIKLLGIPYWKAREIAGFDEGYVDPDGFSSLVQRFRSTGWSKDKAESPPIKQLEFPREFRAISDSLATARHWRYLLDRGFPACDLDDLCYDYDLKATVSGYWSYRVIIPYRFDREVVTWTARHIGRDPVRYLDLSREQSLIPPKETLFNHDAMIGGGRWLILVEGPIDTLKLDFYGKSHGVRTVGLSTNSISEDQLYLLSAGADGFDHVGVMVDNSGATSIVDGMRLKGQLAAVASDVRILKTPGREKDAGAASPRQINTFIYEELA